VILAAALTVFAGLGVGLIMQPTQLISFASVDPQDIGVASGLVNLSRTMGGSLGIAVFGSLYTTRLVDTLDDKLGRRTGQALAASNGQLSPAQLHQLPAPVLATFRTAVTNGLHTLLIGAAVAAATGFVLAWFVRGQLVIRSTVSRPSPSRWPEETAP
jgi:hypothetical protein